MLSKIHDTVHIHTWQSTKYSELRQTASRTEI